MNELPNLEHIGYLNSIIKVERRQHPIYLDWLRYKDDPSMPLSLRDKPIMHEWQYIYTSKKGRISLIELGYPYEGDPLFGGYNWEICGGGFTDDVERFPSKKDAEQRIKKLLITNTRWCFYNAKMRKEKNAM
jgi:hypothetical protein